MKKVSRFWARALIALTIVGVALVIIGAVVVVAWMVMIGAAMFLSSFVIKYIVMVCPECGWRGLPPQWSSRKKRHCVKCGKPIEYDR